MAFPDTPRVVYELNPLDEVTAKVCFPKILRIDVEPPAAFQDRVRDVYPFYRTESALKVNSSLPRGVGVKMASKVALVLPGIPVKHKFTSADNLWAMTLVGDSLSLVTRSYKQWEQFQGRLTSALAVIADIYRPAFFTHMCLRYRNVIRRSRLPSADTPWADLIQPWVAGPLSAGGFTGSVDSAQTRVLFRLDEAGIFVDANYGLAVEEKSQENVFLIESHAYRELRTVPDDAFPAFDALHSLAGRFFRWCVTDRLHEALGPRPVDAERD